jgi:aspartyl aminopeptidase
VSEIVDLELCLADYQPAELLGPNREFLSAPRLDNLVSTFSGFTALVESPVMEYGINMVAAFDNEEIGSQSRMGADSAIMPSLLKRILGSYGLTSQEMHRTFARSMLVSADMAHAVHPNYSEKHQEAHAPKINGGVVIKINANQRYATEAIGAAICRLVSEHSGVPIQEFIVRNDSMCGSTIGPILASKLGMRTVDIGAP